MIIESLATYLEDNSIGTKGTDIFIGELPYDVNNCIALIYSVSADSNKSLDIFEQVVDVFGRFTDSGVGYQKMLDIFNLLHKGQNYDIDDYHIFFSHAQGLVRDNDRDVKMRKLYQLSIRFIFRLIPEVS